MDINSPNNKHTSNKFGNNPPHNMIVVEKEFMYDWQIKAYEL
jgi:hypothetical protein